MRSMQNGVIVATLKKAILITLKRSSIKLCIDNYLSSTVDIEYEIKLKKLHHSRGSGACAPCDRLGKLSTSVASKNNQSLEINGKSRQCC